MAEAQVDMYWCITVRLAITSPGPAAHPSLHPVMLIIFESPAIMIALSQNSEMEPGCSPTYSSRYISSETTQAFDRAARSAMNRRSSRLMTRPVGLEGESTKMSFVLSDRARSKLSLSKPKLPAAGIA
jgi:hypothetical protein